MKQASLFPCPAPLLFLKLETPLGNFFKFSIKQLLEQNGKHLELQNF